MNILSLLGPSGASSDVACNPHNLNVREEKSNLSPVEATPP